MNKYQLLRILQSHPNTNQRTLASLSSTSLGKINQSIKQLQELNFIDQHYHITTCGQAFIDQNKPQRAIILAAGIGFRMIPINQEINKALIDVKGEIIIERLINQLHDANIDEIYVVVGYKKESFEYLIDSFNVKLIVNDQYALSNSLFSLYKAKDYLKNSYIIPCDLYFYDNPFSTFEPYSWYMLSDQLSPDSNITLSKHHQKLMNTTKGNKMVGLSYLHETDYDVFIDKLVSLINNPIHQHSNFEEILYITKFFYGKIIEESKYAEFNECKDLQRIDYQSNCLNHEVFDIITNTLAISKHEITNITALKTGMTNKSFLFETKQKKYIMRIPGKGTDKLINRFNENEVYHVIKEKDISDPILYFNPKNGYKLTRFIEGTHNCDPYNPLEVKDCMMFLKKFHHFNFQVSHSFDIFERIEYYQSLWPTNQSIYKDYTKTKQNVYLLKNFIDSLEKEYTLSHIDAVPDNFLIFHNNQIRLIDWEYAAMQDPHVDIAMFAIYSLYDQIHVDQLIDFYFEHHCQEITRLKIYAYIACCGLLWSNWCEYKHHLGVEFGEYSLYQYHYAKQYFEIVKNKLGDRLYEL